MASQLQANDSQYWRRIVPGFGEPGVTSWNGRTGDVIGTLANIYAFGQGDSPSLDNLFVMPSYTWTFPGLNGANQFGIGAFEQTLTNNANTWNLVRRAADHTINTSKGFNLYAINDPTWNGSGDSLAPVQTWVTQDVRYGNDPTATLDGLNLAQLGQDTWTWEDGGPIVYSPAAGQSFSNLGAGRGLNRNTWLWNRIFGTMQQESKETGYGQVVRQLQVDSHGLVPTHIEQVRYSIGSLTPGDGLAYMFAAGSLMDLNGTAVRGWVGVKTLTAGAALGGEWVGTAGAIGPSPADEFDAQEVYTWSAVRGIEVEIGGLQLPSVDTTTFPVSSAGAARLAWDDTLKQIRGSADGGSYAGLFGFGSSGSFFAEPLFVGGPTSDTLGGAGRGGFFSDANLGQYMAIANQSGGADAEAVAIFLCGSWDATAGAVSQIALTSPAAAGSSLTAGPQNFYLLHLPKVTAPMDIVNGMGPIRFGGSASGGALAEVFEVDTANSLLKLAAPSFKANGAQTVTIGATGPASLTSLTPSKWITIEDNTGAKFAFPVYATT